MAMQKMLLLPAAVIGIIACLTLFFQPISAEALNSPDLNNLKTDLAAFDTYEDMHEYVANRVQRALRQLDNPTDDSYIEAFNQHNEQPSQDSAHKRQKRQIKQRSLPNEPRLFKFEISDAVEPNDEVKQLIKKHRSRELMLEKSTTARPEKVNSGNRNVMRLAPSAEKSKSSRAGRTKRMASRITTAKFPVQLIPFEASDAREPNEETKKIIKRMRALELEQLQQIQATTKPTLVPLPKPQGTPPTVLPLFAKQPTSMTSFSSALSRPKAGKLHMKTMRKRTRRSATQQQQRNTPQMFKFELEDAKEPDQSIKALMEQQNLSHESRESREMKINMTRFERKSDSSDTNSELEDQSSEESKRFYFYKEAPLKTKKSVNSLPHQVHKAITHLFKDNQGAKAYVKYLPAQKMDYNHLRSMTYSGAKAVGSLFHGQKGAHVAPAYVKYVQAVPQPQVHQVQIHPVPVVEKVRYVYAAAPNHGAHAQAYAPQHYPAVQHAPVQQQLVAHPIVVPEAAYVKHAPAQIAEVHHTYSADLAHAQQAAEAEEAAQHASAQQFHASKPDPYFEKNKVGAEEAAAAAEPEAEAPQEEQAAPAGEHNYVPVENYKYELYSKVPQGYIANGKPQQAYSEQPAEAAPLIKIEYHAAPDAVKQNYKNLAEFKQLSALMGKSPEDQFHGLTYLIAKEMQAKRQQQRQQKQLADEALIAHASQPRPQDNTSPILFHPPGYGEEQKAVASNVELSHQGGQSVRLIGMGKSKQYIPIVEQIQSKAAGAGQANEQHQNQVYVAPVENKNYAAQESQKFAAPSSFVHYDISPNYEGGGKAQVHTAKIAAPQVLQHASLSHHGHGGAGGAYKGFNSRQHGGVAASHAGAELELEHNEGGGAAGGIKHGKTIEFRTQIDEREAMQYASKYAFGYRIRDFNTGNDFGHKQNRDLDGVTRGQYHILLPDGRIQNVIYHADDTGFHADVSFETGH